MTGTASSPASGLDISKATTKIEKKKIVKNEKTRLPKVKKNRVYHSTIKKGTAVWYSYSYQCLKKYGIQNQIKDFMRVMSKESGGDPYNDNKLSGCIGLMQFMPSTFYANAKIIGLKNANIRNPYHQIKIASFMWSINQQNAWTTY